MKIIDRKLLTKEEFEVIFAWIENKKYSEIKEEILQSSKLSCANLDTLFEELTLPSRFSLEWKDVVEKMNSTNHIDLYYWEFRYFLQEAFRDSYLWYPYEGYLYRKVLMLKSAFISWLSLCDKIEKIVNIKENYPEFWEKYWKSENAEVIIWLSQSTSFRQFSNDIKHNHDYLSEIQIAEIWHGYWTYPTKNGVSVFKTGKYPHDIVSSFFYQECFQKLLIAFNALIKLVNSLPKTL